MSIITNDGLRADLDDNRSVTGWKTEKGSLHFLFENNGFETQICLFVEAVTAMYRIALAFRSVARLKERGQLLCEVI